MPSGGEYLSVRKSVRVLEPSRNEGTGWQKVRSFVILLRKSSKVCLALDTARSSTVAIHKEAGGRLSCGQDESLLSRAI
jgi:hypothetical protein